MCYDTVRRCQKGNEKQNDNVGGDDGDYDDNDVDDDDDDDDAFMVMKSARKFSVIVWSEWRIP